MKAVYYTKNGSADEVLTFGEMETPAPGPGEVLVKVIYSGVNPSDVKSRAGRPLAFDHVIPHSDGSGVIEAVGEGADAGRIGEYVWTWNSAWRRADGTCAEYVCLPSAQAAKLPDGVSMETGACLGIPGLTAAHAMNLLAAEAGAKTVLITGAGSTVGNLITQMAYSAGYRVIGTASPRRQNFALSAGCDLVINPHSIGIADQLFAATSGQSVDAIIDMDFSSTAGLLPEGILKPHGVLIGYGSNDMTQTAFDFRFALFNALRFSFFVVYELTPAERKAAEDRLLASLTGGLEIAIDSVFELSETATAHKRVETGEAVGNVLVRV